VSLEIKILIRYFTIVKVYKSFESFFREMYLDSNLFAQFQLDF
jgi:hypothetical protein